MTPAPRSSRVLHRKKTSVYPGAGRLLVVAPDYAGLLLALIFPRAAGAGWKETVQPSKIRLAYFLLRISGPMPRTRRSARGWLRRWRQNSRRLHNFRTISSVISPVDVRTEKVTSVLQARRAFNISLALAGSIQNYGSGLRFIIYLVDAQSLQQVGAETLRNQCRRNGRPG